MCVEAAKHLLFLYFSSNTSLEWRALDRLLWREEVWIWFNCQTHYCEHTQISPNTTSTFLTRPRMVMKARRGKTTKHSEQMKTPGSFCANKPQKTSNTIWAVTHNKYLMIQVGLSVSMLQSSSINTDQNNEDSRLLSSCFTAETQLVS